MKNKIFRFVTIAAVMSLFSSCEDGEEVASIVQIAKPTMTIEAAANPTLAEGSLYSVTFNLSAPVSEPFTVFILRLNQSTAADVDSDVAEQSGVSFQKSVNIPAFATTFTTTIEVAEDDLVEGNETLVLQIGDSRTTAVNFLPINRTITIANVVSDRLVLDFNFDRTFTGSGGYTNTLCAVTSGLNPGKPYDIDYILVNESGADTNNTTAQTGACVEEMVIDLANPAVTDGLYTVFAFVFTNADLDQAISPNPIVVIPEFTIPMSVDYLRSGGINAGRFNQESQFFLTSAAPEGTATPVVDIRISTVGGKRKFTIQSSTGTIAASGKFAGKKKLK